MYIAIIGGSGFVGTRLTARLLAAGYDIKIVDTNDSRKYPALRVYADVRDCDTLKKELSGADIVINLAAEHHDNVMPKCLYDEVNVSGAENVCKVCAELGIKKIIFSSSAAVYGFAPPGTDETGRINYFNDYGRTKWLAEEKYREWLKSGAENSLTIIRFTVIFGEQNRGNVYNLLRQIADGTFLMVGKGVNFKSMAYVENAAAFIGYNLSNGTGEYLFNYTDKPDFDMNTLVAEVRRTMGKLGGVFHWPYWMGYCGGFCFDLLSKLTRKTFPISLIRVKKFCTNTMIESAKIKQTGFEAPVSLIDGLEKTIKYEFIDGLNA
ncbi:MAG: NAD-dependent epimerase/dehydratase family protein [Treponema sp.]|jgi:nucleoside-diphosphate-sugar epimerase|nr:NAD-dependent epimerase/dehydratase family protein [Treponema sp.]